MNKFGIILEQHGIDHQYCTDHIFHLSCKGVLYDNGSYADDGISAAEMNTPKACVVVGRNLVAHFNRSTQATAKLKECQRILQQMHALIQRQYSS